LFLPFFPCKKGNQNAQSVKAQHGGSEDSLVDKIRSGSDDGGDDKNNQDCILNVFYHPSSRDKTHAGEKEDKRRQFKDKGDS